MPMTREGTPNSDKGALGGAPPRKPSFKSAWRHARELVWAHRGRLALGLALMIVSRLLGLVLPASAKFLIDDVIGQGKRELLVPLGLAVLAASVLQAGTSFLLAQILGVAAQRAITDMRKRVQEHVMRLPVSYFDATQTGQLISRIVTDAEGIRNLVGSGLVQLFGGFFTACLALGVLFYLNWHLTLATLAVLAAFGGVMAFGFSRLRPLFRERGKIQAEVTGRLGESLGGVRVVKAYTAEGRERLVFAQGAHRLLRNVARSISAVSGVQSVAILIIGLIGAIMILVGGGAVARGEMSLGDFIAYVFFTGMMTVPIINIASIGTQISEAFAGLDRIREVLALDAENDGDAAREHVGEVRGEIVFENVGFEYEPGVPVLRDVSFRAAPGSTTALVGSSGSGKSTLIGLVMAFHQPKSGRVAVDGRDLAKLRLREYRQHLGVVLQENFLFDGTIGENIRFSRPRAEQAELEAASRTAHCHEFVSRFEKGYDTLVGERGVKLSGGQRQRVAIARALLAQPRLLILDEATSHLDSESEHMIQEGLAALRRGRTTFVIAHRLSTIRSADQILVLEAGRIVERGTHAQLLELGGRYRELYEQQHAVQSDSFINPGEEFNAEGHQAAAASLHAPWTKHPSGN
ncbi:MAG: ABC transporter ATP-binding protein/permease [Planctomycetota bacterium]|nr:ABC transporter ATP-binding protein/permease [Planctomycetota bacterium]